MYCYEFILNLNIYVDFMVESRSCEWSANFVLGQLMFDKFVNGQVGPVVQFPVLSIILRDLT